MIQDDVRPMLKEFLVTLGFEAMARDVVIETEWSRLQHYARVIYKQIPSEEIKTRFSLLRLL